MERILSFYQYAGLAMYRGPASRGEKHPFKVFDLNHSALIYRNAIVAKSSRSIKENAAGIKEKPGQEYFTRATISSLFGPEGVPALQLALPSCQVCGKPRIHEDAKFCSYCGSLLKSASINEELVNRPIDELPLTPQRLKAIIDHSSIRKIKDILIDLEGELLKVPRIGRKRRAEIIEYIEEYIS